MVLAQGGIGRSPAIGRVKAGHIRPHAPPGRARRVHSAIGSAEAGPARVCKASSFSHGQRRGRPRPASCVRQPVDV